MEPISQETILKCNLQLIRPRAAGASFRGISGAEMIICLESQTLFGAPILSSLEDKGTEFLIQWPLREEEGGINWERDRGCNGGIKANLIVHDGTGMIPLSVTCQIDMD